MTRRSTHHCTEGLVGEIRNPDKGWGLYTTREIRAGELVCMWGGDILDRDQLALCNSNHQMHAVQVAEGLYIVPHGEPEPGDYVNHSCDPNVGIKGQIAVVAMRDIRAGEEICFDYAMTDASDYDEFDCACGASTCRGKVTGRDWMRKDLQARYRGWFSFYLQGRIDAMYRGERGLA
jgi:SET domain-containing protein